MLLALVFLFSSVQVYEFNVTRVRSDVYSWNVPGQARHGFVITGNCWEAAENERAVVRYENDSSKNKIIFIRSGNVCDVTFVTFEDKAP